MKSKCLITILSIASLATIMPIVAHQKESLEIQDKKQHIDVMLEDIQQSLTKVIFDLDQTAEQLYSKYRKDENFQELIRVFRSIHDRCHNPSNFRFETNSFREALENIKHYLNGTEDIKRSQIAWVLFVRYNNNPYFTTMRQLFEKIVKIQESEQNRYKDAMEAVRKLNRYAGLGIGTSYTYKARRAMGKIEHIML